MEKEKVALPFQDEEYLVKVGRFYTMMTAGEQKIADFLLATPNEELQEYNIRDFAALTSTSTAAITRFCKTIGFSGFSEFRYNIRKGTHSSIGTASRVTANDDVETVAWKVAGSLSQMAQEAAEFVDSYELERAMEFLADAETVYFIGAGSGGGVAHMGTSMFQNAGVKSLCLQDELMSVRFAATLTPKDVVIGITNDGNLKSTVDVMATAQGAGARTIGITSNAKGLLRRYSDAFILTPSAYHGGPVDVSVISIGQITVLNVLQILISLHSAEKTAQRRMKVMKLSELKRYDVEMKEINCKRMKN